jgi:hypothetical protein
VDLRIVAETVTEEWSKGPRKTALQRVREYLGKLSPYFVLRLFLDETWTRYLPEKLRDQVATQYPTKRKLLKWVYDVQEDGSDPRLLSYDMWQYMPRVSPSKVDLTEALLLACRPTLSWLTPKILNAFAFRQKHFLDKEQPLYFVRAIRQMNGKSRTLQIPGRSLKCIQKTILTLLLNSAQEKMPSYVMGGRRSDPANSRRFGIFENAQRHLGQEFVASFDLANFFPSVPFASVLEVLQEIQWLPPGSSESQKLQFDAALLIAKLCTFRGRLPQGAPTSPALANLVFSKLESNLRERFHQDFVYTRYYDDITISLSVTAARRQRICAARELEEYAEAVLKDALRGSAFELNPRKTRSSSREQGHLVTGLRVGESTVSLPRNKRRMLTAIMHQIERDGLVQTACRHIDEFHVRETNYVPKHLGHRHSHRYNNAEDFSVHVLRQLCPGLQIELSPQSFRSDDGDVTYEGEKLSGNSAISIIKVLLTQSWAGHLRPQKVAGGVAFEASGGVVLANVLAEKNIDFFLLDRRAALKTTELWYYLRGWASGMRVKSPDHCFAPLHVIQQRVQKTLVGVSISVNQPNATTVESEKRGLHDNSMELQNSETFSLHPSVKDVPQQATIFTTSYNEFHEAIANNTHETELTSLLVNLRVPAKSNANFVLWVQTLSEVIFGHLEKLPAVDAGRKGNLVDAVELVRILPDRVNGNRSLGYRVESQFLHQIGLRENNIVAVGDGSYTLLQSRCLQLLQQTFSDSLKLRGKKWAPDEWLTRQRVNEWCRPLDETIAGEVKLLAVHLENARWKTTGDPIFIQRARKQLRKDSQVLSSECESETSQAAWIHLFSICQKLNKILLDSLHGTEATFSEPVRATLRKFKEEGPFDHDGGSTKRATPNRKAAQSAHPSVAKFLYRELHEEVGTPAAEALHFVYLVRNRDSHLATNSADDAKLTRIQKVAADWLGRERPKVAKRADASHPIPDLPLTALEASELQVIILRSINRGLNLLCQPTPTF